MSRHGVKTLCGTRAAYVRMPQADRTANRQFSGKSHAQVS
jgi:hypothetical protein